MPPAFQDKECLNTKHRGHNGLPLSHHRTKGVHLDLSTSIVLFICNIIVINMVIILQLSSQPNKLFNFAFFSWSNSSPQTFF